MIVDRLVNVMPTITTMNPGLKYIPSRQKQALPNERKPLSPKTLSQSTIRIVRREAFSEALAHRRGVERTAKGHEEKNQRSDINESVVRRAWSALPRRTGTHYPFRLSPDLPRIPLLCHGSMQAGSPRA